jgi:hypothetical protein
MLYNPSDHVVHKDAVFMRNIWHQQTLKAMAKEIQFELSTNCTSTPDTRLQVFLAWARQQFEIIFPPPVPAANPVVSIVKKAKLQVAEAAVATSERAAPCSFTVKEPPSNAVIKISFQSKSMSTAAPPVLPKATSSSTATNLSLPLKAAAPAAAAASKEVSSAPFSKAFDISAVPVVKVSGPLLRSCSKAVSTIVGDPEMMWFVTPGECAFVCMRACCLS